MRPSASTGQQSDAPTRFEEFKIKAEKGDAEAQYNLATYYANDGSRADGLATAMAWYRKAADQADPFAQFALGVMYRRGLGVPEDADTGAIWLSKAMNTVASFPKSNLAWANNEGRVVPSFVTSFIDEMRDKANDVA